MNKIQLDKIINILPKSKVKLLKKGKNFHILLTGDSAKILESFPDGSVDVIFTDPPYNARLNYGDTYNDNLPRAEYFEQTLLWFKDYARILSDKGCLYLMNYPEINARILPYLEDKLGLIFKRWITWHYPTNIGHSRNNFTRSQRSILFLSKTDNHTFNRDRILQPYKNPGVGKIKKLLQEGSKGRAAYDFLDFIDLLEMRTVENDFSPLDVHDVDLLKNVSKDRLNEKHPCQLPFELIKRLLLVSSKAGDVVLDPFAGTFSTSSVATNLGLSSVGIEINPEYVNLGLERLKRHVTQ